MFERVFALVSWTETDSIHLVLVGVVVATMLAWGVYAVQLTFTNPGDQTSIGNEVMKHNVGFTAFIMNNGTTIQPSSSAQFIADVKNGTIPVYGSFALPSGGFVYITGWEPSNSTVQRYVVFTFSFDSPSAGACCNQTLWLSGPQGNITNYLEGQVDRVLSAALVGHFANWIVPVNSPGNYTLHYLNRQSSANVLGRVAIGESLAVFSYQHPYLYPGIVTVSVASVFAAMTVYVSWRKLSKES